MPKTEKQLLPLDLAGYDVYIEDRTANSDYFQVSKVPQLFTGGKNSFLIAGSDLLQNGSEILIEILDSQKKPIYQTIVPIYTEADAKMVSVDIYSSTPSGPAYIIILGKAISKSDGTEIPFEWQNVYNVRWIKQVLVDYDVNNISPLVFQNNPQILVTESRFFNRPSSSYTTQTSSISASLSPSLFASVQSGYSIKSDTRILSSSFTDMVITGSLTINQKTRPIRLPITKILNDNTAYTYGYYLESPLESGSIIRKLFLKSGSYKTNILDTQYDVTSSAVLQYSIVNYDDPESLVSFANIRLSNLSTVSGELYKVKVYNKIATSVANYKLLADVLVASEELLVTSSNVGNLPIGDISQTPIVTNNWYAGQLTRNTGVRNILYPVSGTLTYYNPTIGTNQFTVLGSDNVLLSAIHAQVPVTGSSPFFILPNTQITSSKYTTQASESGYFIGTKRFVDLFPTTEYTFQLDAYYKNISSSYYLNNLTPKVDIYIIGTETSKLVTDNPLGQKIGELTVAGDNQWFEQKQFNFTPKLATLGEVGVRLVVSDGFWYFSNLSLKPATDPQFSPDEMQILIPNTEYNNELLEYKVEFFDINSNSAPVSAVSVPTYFSGSAVN